MPAQGRKNVHGKTGVRFKAAYTKSKYENMLRNVLTDLVFNGSVKVTASVGKDITKGAAKLISFTKKEDVMNAKRAAASILRVNSTDERSALDVLFNDLGPKMKDRKGGYTRTLKLGNRRGDDAPMVLVAWVD